MDATKATVTYTPEREREVCIEMVGEEKSPLTYRCAPFEKRKETCSMDVDVAPVHRDGYFFASLSAASRCSV
jgi:hypothetical protein